jgi:lambda family phage portal protein
MGLFDRIAGLFSSRAAARSGLAEVQALLSRQIREDLEQRWYDAGRTSRDTWGWMAGSTSANAEIYGGFVNLRNRSRDLVRNNGFATKALRVLADNAVGTGITAVARTKNARVNARINDLWAEFCDECDFGGQFDLYGLQRLAVRSLLEGGETVIRLRTSSVTPGERAVPLQLQLLEGDYIDHRKNGTIDGKGNVHLGIEFDGEGKRAAYWLFRMHPGEMIYTEPMSYISDRVPAREVLHVYEPLRIGQARGVPWFSSGIVDARNIKTYQEAERVRKRIEACVAAIVMGADDESQEPIAPLVTDYAGNRIEQFEPGLIAIARGSKDIKFTQPASNNTYPEAMRTDLQALSAAWGLTYELLTGDLSRVNYSSIKAGINEFRRSIETLQWLTIVPMMMKPIWKNFIDRAVIAGKLPQGTPYSAEFTTPKFEAVDPVKETDGDIAAVRALLMPPQEAIRRRGYDPDVVLADFKAWHDALTKAGLVSDADAGLQARPGAAADAPPPGATKDQ